MASASTFRAGPPSPFQSTSPSGYSNVDAYGRGLPPSLHSTISQGTLGPVFSDEEDGDDSDFIAAKMAQLGFAPDGRSYQGAMASPPSSTFSPVTATTSQPAAMQAELLRALQQQHTDRLRYQQQALLQQLNFPLPVSTSNLGASPQITTSAQQAALNQQLRAQMVAREQAQRLALAGATQSATVAPLQQQYMNQLQQLQLRQMQLAALQSQSLASAFAQPTAYPASSSLPLGQSGPAVKPQNEQRQRNLGPQTNRSTPRIPTGASVSDSSNSPPSSVEHIREGSNSSTTSTGKAQGRFAQAKQAMEASGGASPIGSLQALLARRQPTLGPSSVTPSESSATSPTSSTADEVPNKREMMSGIGLGRPSPNSQSTDRSITLPVPLVQKQSIPPTRAASYAAPALVRRAVPVRQPNGPPGNADKLKEDNFKAMIRRKAGLGLGMLNRRSEPTTPNPNASG